MVTSSKKTHPKRSNRSQVNYNYEYFDYDSCTEGEEIDNIFFKWMRWWNQQQKWWFTNWSECWRWFDVSSATAPKKKKNLSKELRGSKARWR